MSFSITQLKGIRMGLSYLLEVLITVYIICLPLRYDHAIINYQLSIPFVEKRNTACTYFGHFD